jgi:hypothetical protein
MERMPTRSADARKALESFRAQRGARSVLSVYPAVPLLLLLADHSHRMARHSLGQGNSWDVGLDAARPSLSARTWDPVSSGRRQL